MTHGKCLAASATLGQISTPLASGFLSCETKDAFVVHGRAQRTLSSCFQVQPPRLPELVLVLSVISWDCSWWRISKWFFPRDSYYHHGKIKNSTFYSPTESKAEPGTEKKLSQPKPGHKPKFIDSLKSLFSFVSTLWVCRGWFISIISFNFSSNYPLQQPGQHRVRLRGQGMWRKDKPLVLQARSRRILVKSPSSALP